MTATRVSRVGRAAIFAPLEQDSRPEQVARSVSDAIALGLLAHGQQLPSEAELADRFKVSPSTVRHALTLLRRDGLVDTRRGRTGGSFVTAPDDPAQQVLELRLRQTPAGVIRDLGDHYAAIGGAAAALAAGRAANDDIERLQQAAAGLASAHSPRERRRAEGLFHIEVAAAAQSVRLTREEIALQRDVAPLLWLVTNRSEEQIVQEHVDLAQAIADHDADAARRHAEEHILVAVKAALSLQRDLLHSETAPEEAPTS